MWMTKAIVVSDLEEFFVIKPIRLHKNWCAVNLTHVPLLKVLNFP